MPAHSFEIHGFRFAVDGTFDEAIAAIRNDFVWFEAPRDDVDLRITIDLGTPDLSQFGDVTASRLTDWYVAFRVDSKTVVDYLGDALAVVDGSAAHVVGSDPRATRRAAWEVALEAVGGHLDRIGMPRLFGLGLTGAAGAVLVVLPSGGGKTTLALRALREDGVRLLSEGSPLVDRDGLLHPLPFPLWVRDRAPEAASLPLEHVRRVAGELSDPRILELSAFADRIERNPTPLAHVVLGRRSLGSGSTLEPLPRRAAMATLVRDSVIGFGLLGAPEALLRARLRGLPGAAGPLTRRALACRAALNHAKVWQLTLGRDREDNWRALEPLLR